MSRRASTLVFANGLLQGARPEGDRACAPFAALLTDLDLVAVIVTQLRQCRFERGSGQSCRRQVGDPVSRRAGNSRKAPTAAAVVLMPAASPLRYHRDFGVTIRAST